MSAAAGRRGSGYGKVTGRVLSLGFPLPGVLVDNYTFLSAPSFFDYDAIVVDPHALATLIEGVIDGSVEGATFGGVSVRNAPEAPGVVPLVDVLQRRREETRKLLANGGVILCFAWPSTLHRGIVAGEEMDDFWWLDERPPLTAGEGSRAYVVDYEHPLAAFVDSQLANITYRAHIDLERTPDAQVFVRSQGGAILGAEYTAGGGRIALLPALTAVPSGDARYAMSDELQAGIRRMLGLIAEGRPPSWIGRHPLPGMSDRADALAATKAALDDATVAFELAESAHADLARYQQLLWQEGAVGLEDVVVDALRLIGLDVYATDRTALELRVDYKAIFFEIEGSERQIDMAAHHRLRQRIERAIEARGEAPRGVLFVNGRRLDEPAARGAGVSREIEIAALAMRYCLAPTSTLYEAVVAKLRGDEEAVMEYRRSLVGTDGILAP